MRWLLGVLLIGLLALPAWAVPTVDGTRDAEYGAPLAVQTLETQFGDNASELNAGYGVMQGGKLFLMLTGNIESNFNKIELFIDSKAGGQSVFDSSGNDNANRMDGMVFDAGFTADYHIIARRGNSMGNDKFDLDFADLGAQTASGYLDFLDGSGIEGTGSTGTGVNAIPIAVGYNNSNIAGVDGGTGAADQAAAAAVTTGLELGIALSDLGYAGGPIRVMVGVNNGDHNFWSNQFLGGLPTDLMNGIVAGTGNLGGDGDGTFTGTAVIDFSGATASGKVLSGNQFFTVPVPEPSSVALAVVALAGLAGFGRRRTY